MSVPLTVNNTTFQYPTVGDEPGWGEAASGWSEEVTDVLADLKTDDDILQTAALVNNNTTDEIVGLVFNSATVRSAIIQYTIYRTTGASEKLEEGEVSIAYKDLAGTWLLSQEFIGDSGVVLTIDGSGQFSYVSDNFVGQTSGLIKFRATALQKV